MASIDLLKVDCEGAEYLLFEQWSAMGAMPKIGWIRGEWHCRPCNVQLHETMGGTHVFHIDPNDPHSVGHFVGHRRPS